MVDYASGSDLSDPQALGEGLGQRLLFSSNAERKRIGRMGK
jgi:hypothetical protein